MVVHMIELDYLLLFSFECLEESWILKYVFKTPYIKKKLYNSIFFYNISTYCNVLSNLTAAIVILIVLLEILYFKYLKYYSYY